MITFSNAIAPIALCLITFCMGVANAQTPTPATQSLPVLRALTSTAGRKLEGTIIAKSGVDIKFRRTTDGKEFTLPIDKLSADDQIFVAGLEVSTTPDIAKPAAGGNPVKVLYLITPKMVFVGDVRTIEALTKLGCEVTLSTLDGTAKTEWDVQAVKNQVGPPVPGQGDDITHAFPTRTTMTGNILPKDKVNIDDYDVLFVGTRHLGVSNLAVAVFGLDPEWVKKMSQPQKTIVFQASSSEHSRDELLNGEKHRKVHHGAENFVVVDENFIQFNDTRDYKDREKNRQENTGDGSYDPKITVTLMKAIKDQIDKTKGASH